MTDLATLGIAVTTNGIDDANSKLDTFVGKAAAAGTAADNFGTKASAAVKDTGAAAVTGADRVNSAFATMTAGITNANRATTTTASGVQSMGSQIDAALARNTASFATMTAGIAQANTVIGASKTATDSLAAAHGGLSTQEQALFHFIRSTSEQLALGVPATQAFTSGLNHLTFAMTGEGGLTGAFSGVMGMVGRLASSFVNPITATLALGAGALYLGNSWEEAQVKINQSLIGIGQRTGTTASDINKFAEANSSATGLSVQEARNVATEFTKTGNITISSLKGMGDAVKGYSILTGTDATTATKALATAFSGDLVAGAKKLNETYGFLDTGLLDYLRSLNQFKDRAAGIQAITNAMAADNKKAEDSVGSLTKAWDAFSNFMSNFKNGASFSGAPDLKDQLAAAQKARDEAAATADSASNGISRNSRGELVSANQNMLGLDDLTKQAQDAQTALDNLNGESAAKELKKLSEASDGVVHALIPEIDKIKELKDALKLIESVKTGNGTGITSLTPAGSDTAATAIQNIIAKTQEAQGQAERYNQRVAAISTQWGDVGQSTALALQHAQNQLPVYEAVGGAARMAAQATADYKNYMDQGKTATEAAALAASNLAARQAQVTSAAQEQLASLQDAYAVASARTVQEQISAAARATYNQLLRDGVDMETAEAVASQQAANARAQVYQQMEKQVQASRDMVALYATQGTAEQAQVKSAIAYRQAIDAGADSTQAGIIATNTARVATAQWAEQAQKVAEAYENAARAAHDAQYSDITPGGDNSFGFFSLKSNTPHDSTSPVGLSILNAYNQAGSTQSLINGAAAGGVNAALNLLKNAGASTGPMPVNGLIPAGATWEQYGLASKGSQSDIDSAVSQLFSIKETEAGNDKNAKLGVYNDELSYYEGKPQTLATLQKIADLKNSIDQLKNSTDSLTAAETASLNPLYNGRGALQIGYYKAASGLDMIAQGPTTGDQVPFHAMVNGGERITITPAGQSPETASSGNSSGGRSVNNYNMFNFGNSSGNSRRSARQVSQGFGQAMAAVS